MTRHREIELLCTVGPSSFEPDVLERLVRLGVSVFRINLSHTPAADLPRLLEELQARGAIAICVDTEGAQVRTGALSSPITLRDNDIATIIPFRSNASGDQLSLRPGEVVGSLRPGDLISIDFDAVLVQVVESSIDGVRARVLHGGNVAANKAVTVERDLSLPPLTRRDHEALTLTSGVGVSHVALSFAHTAADVDTIRSLVDPGTKVIAKIECLAGLRNLSEIGERADALLIDRGDLSRELAIERIPAAQDHIIEAAHRLDRPVYVATNLLESMTAHPYPTRAEVNDVIRTLESGADGLVLAAETAIGAYPVGCAAMIRRLIREFQADKPRDYLSLARDPVSLLPAPHGGFLVQREAADGEVTADLPRVQVDGSTLLDCEQIATGMYSPIEGFMGADELRSVLDELRLLDGPAWTLPIVMQLHPDIGGTLTAGMRIVLTDQAGVDHALMDISEVYPVDLAELSSRLYGTHDPAHPGVSALLERGSVFVAGEVALIRHLASPLGRYELTPQQTRRVLAHKGWSRVVGFHTRNVCHRAHEYIQVEAVRRANADGLLISPVVGPRQPGDFAANVIVDTYELLLRDEAVYPPGSALLACFATHSRYAGPREAVFTALCRKNMGCSHFVIGRDHAGAGGDNGEDGSRRIFDDVGDIGIEPVFFDAVAYDPTSESYVEGPTAGTESLAISGSELRRAVLAGTDLPSWFVRPAVLSLIRKRLDAGERVFL